MRKIWIVAISVLMVAACRKDRFVPIPSPPGPIDSGGVVLPDTFLTQDIYKVVSYNIPRTPAEILLSPYVFANQNSAGRVMVFNERGQLMKEKETPGATFCFRRWVVNGKVRYTYIVNDINTTHIAGINQLTGYAVIADENLNEIKKVYLQTHNDIVAGAGYVGLDVHEFILLDDDHYISMAYYPKTVSNIPAALNPNPNLQVVACVIQEVQNGQVIWQWDGTNYPEFYTTSVEGNDYTNATVPQDYMHLNSITVDPRDNNLICSFRHLDQVLKIDRQNGNILWRLGGTNSNFPLSTTQIFLRQHNATLINNSTLLLFDNGELNSRPYSRILEMELNETTRTVTAFKSFNVPEPFSQYMGSVQKFGENYFIGGGTGNYALEINAQTKARNIEFLSDQSSYRAYKYELK
ncbi:MAG: hypothetical protein EOP51_08465 [Sphingobacteriales bacterium]|nr:MAG: hypothetical protein EOP51_08465 [Sphingobacteriales bacterium]